jgi:hypothetical protein
MAQYNEPTGDAEKALLAALRSIMTQVPVGQLVSVCATWIGMAIHDATVVDRKRGQMAEIAVGVIKHHAGIERMAALEDGPFATFFED